MRDLSETRAWFRYNDNIEQISSTLTVMDKKMNQGREGSVSKNKPPKAKRTLDEQRLQPTTIDASINEADVLSGRSKLSFNHAGNKRFRDLVSGSLEGYMKADSRFEKSLVVHSILDTIANAGGRFLKYNGAEGKWKEMSRQQAKEKCGHAIRDAVNSFEARRKKTKAGSNTGVTDEVMHRMRMHAAARPPPMVDYSAKRRADADFSASRKRQRTETRAPPMYQGVPPVDPSPLQHPQQKPAAAERPPPVVTAGGLVAQMPSVQTSPIEQLQAFNPAFFGGPGYHTQHPMTVQQQQQAMYGMPIGVGARDPVAMAQQMQEQHQREVYFQQQQQAQQQQMQQPPPDAEEDMFSQAINLVLGPHDTEQDPLLEDVRDEPESDNMYARRPQG